MPTLQKLEVTGSVKKVWVDLAVINLASNPAGVQQVVCDAAHASILNRGGTKLLGEFKPGEQVGGYIYWEGKKFDPAQLRQRTTLYGPIVSARI